MSKIELGSKDFWERIKNDPASLAYEVCSIDLSNMEQTLMHQASLRAWVNAVHESAKIDEEQAKWELTRTKARVMLEAKSTVDPHSGKSKTVSALEAEVDSHEDTITAQEALFAVQRRKGALRAMADALTDRRDMLIQIAAKQRDEMKEYS